MDYQIFLQKIIGSDEFQTGICRTGSNQIVGAGAGTGKTYQLVQKYLYELFRLEANNSGPAGAAVENLAAITFTEKAALEMKERIRKKLKELRPSPPEKGSRILDELYRRMDGAYIGTIHSFCSRLLRENPGESGVDPQFSIMEEAESSAVLKEQARSIVDEGLREADFGICALVDGYGYEGRNYAQGILNILISVYQACRTLGVQFGQLIDLYNKGLALLAPEFQESLQEASRAAAFFEQGGWPKQAQNFSILWTGRRDWLSGLHFNTASIDDLEYIRELSDAIAGNWGRNEAKESKDRLKESLQELADMILDKALKPHLERVQELLIRIDAGYEERKRELSSLDFNDLEQKTLTLLHGFPHVAEDYRGRFQVILIDEFQDTNPVQFKILSELIRPGVNRLFAVGDHKQSIYGFRGADVSLFNDLYGGKSPLNPHVHSLKTCRRSTQRLIRDFFNPFFRSVMGTGSPGNGSFGSRYEERDEMDVFRSSSGTPAEIITFFSTEQRAAYVRLAEADAIARRIAHLTSGNGGPVAVDVFDDNEQPRPPRFGDIVVLFRSLTNIEIYLEALRRRRIPHYLVKGRGFFQSQEVRDIANFFTFLNYGGEQTALAGVLRSPLVCVKDETIYRLRRPTDEPVPLYRYFHEPCLDFPRDIQEEERIRLRDFRDWFRRMYALRDRMLISELIERTIEKSSIDSVYAGGFQGDQRLANLHKLIEVARGFERQRARTLRDFVLYLNELMESETQEPEAEIIMEHEDVVRLMSVHQAKGLQFPIVFVADVQSAQVQPARENHILHPLHGLVLKPPDPAAKVPVATYRWQKINELRGEMEREELKRLLYVACTRARDHLILSGVYQPAASRTEQMVWLSSLVRYLGTDENYAGPLEDKGCVVVPAETVPEPPSGAPELSPSLAEILEGAEEDPRLEPPALMERITGPGRTHRPIGQFTATDLNLFHGCPRHYFFQRLLGLKTEAAGQFEEPEYEGLEAISGEYPADRQGYAGPSADRGTLLHWVLEHIPFDAADEEILARLDSGIRFFDQTIQGREREELFKVLRRTLNLPLLASLKGMRIEREHPFLFSLKRGDDTYIIKGTMDLLARGDNEQIIVDYKYAAPKPGLEDYYDLQLAIYGAAAATIGVPAQTVLVYMKPDPPRVDRRLVVRPDDSHDMVTGLCADLLECERKTLRKIDRAGIELWEPNSRVCSALNCGYRAQCSTS